MTFDESELVIQEEIQKSDGGSRSASHAGESSADVRVGFATGRASTTSRAATRMTGRETALSGAANSSIVQQVKKTMKGALTGANIAMITELGEYDFIV